MSAPMDRSNPREERPQLLRSSRAEQVRKEVDAAFSEVPAPERGQVVWHPEEDWEDAELLRDFAGKRREELPPDVLHYHREMIGRLRPQAFAYYLPAFIHCHLDDPEDRGDIKDYLVLTLAPTEERSNAYGDYFEAFTESQAKAILSYLRLIWDAYGPSLLWGGWTIDELDHYYRTRLSPGEDLGPA